jgi:nitroreductase
VTAPLPHDDAPDLADFAAGLIAHRRHVRFKLLAQPGLDAAQTRVILEAGACAPDHRQLRPWRFIGFSDAARAELGQWFVEALLERDPQAEPAAQARARDKAQHGATLLLAVAEVPSIERLISLGAALQNMLLMATALGLGSGLGGGRALSSAALRRGLNLQDGEHAVCFVAFGQAQAEPDHVLRPDPAQFTEWR